MRYRARVDCKITPTYVKVTKVHEVLENTIDPDLGLGQYPVAFTAVVEKIPTITAKYKRDYVTGDKLELTADEAVTTVTITNTVIDNENVILSVFNKLGKPYELTAIKSEYDKATVDSNHSFVVKPRM
jgi:hypothetical protein